MDWIFGVEKGNPAFSKRGDPRRKSKPAALNVVLGKTKKKKGDIFGF